MKKYIPYAVITILIVILLSFIPTIQRGQKLSKLNELWQVRQECETKQLTAQTEAKKLREELGLITASQPQVVVKTWTQVQLLTGSIIE